MVLLITWVVAAVAAKLLAFDKTRNFLQEQTELLATNWFNILQTTTVNNTAIKETSNQIVLAWRGEELVFTQGDVTLKRPTVSESYIETIGDDKWIMNSQCESGLCVLAGFKDTVRQGAVRSLILLIFLPLFAIFSLAMLAMYYAVRSGLQPLNSLAKTVSITPVDNLNLLPSNVHTKELSPLVKSINQLITNMQNQLVKERQFLDTCTHELRTPITALVAQVQTLETQDKTLKFQLEKIHISAMRTVRVANQFLRLARNSNADKLGNNHQVFDFCELMRQTTIDVLSKTPNVEYQMVGKKTAMVNADSLSIEFLCRNLIENIQKYALSTFDDRGKVIITFEKEDQCLRLTVEDSGRGVSEKHREHLCQRFYRVNNNASSGAGLGLSIIKEVAERYDGSVTLGKSQDLGGLKVVVEFHSILLGSSDEACLDDYNTQLSSM